MIQRDTIFQLMTKGKWLESLDVLKLCQNSGNPKVVNMEIEPIRRCLQELWRRKKVDCVEGKYNKKTLKWEEPAWWRAK